ncbi:TspO/MBR family protein [Limnohabitans sp.]|uniref:TspO/MBR family protein n=1 Tax=Limnohabitans sp. TaxID=1907725 RepID=UPI0037BE410F
MNPHPERGLLMASLGRMRHASVRALLVAFVLSFATAGIGAALTELGPWYFALKHPPWKPPDAAFGVIWSTIFTLCAISGWLAWQAANTPALRRRVLLLFGVNAVLNIVWSALYFKLQRPDWALLEVVFLWLSVLALILGLWRLSRWASLLLISYWVWVSIAAVLNLQTVMLNGPFAAPSGTGVLR